MKLVTRGALIRLLVLVALPALAAWWFLLRMPGRRFEGAPGAADPALVAELRRDVGAFGERNVFHPQALEAAAARIEAELRAAGYAPAGQEYEVGRTTVRNIEAEVRGGAEIVVVGAHYDSVAGSPGANDNGSGVAATLALARRFAKGAPRRTLRFVFFVNEEPPWFQGKDMGSLRYARRCRERDEDVVAMLSLETLACFSNESGSQRYPIRGLGLLYGDRGNYVAFVGNVASRGLVREAVGLFREHARIPSEGIALWDFVPGVGWSDHWAFWECGYRAVMVTDTAPFRYPHYHQETDTPDRLDYDGLARVVEGLVPVVAGLAELPAGTDRAPTSR
ncbi:MAG TPA: M28 family peptidase [Planctomycetota bacterium]|nr:M28 family peptidase [Planctomycetota bacterium]